MTSSAHHKVQQWSTSNNASFLVAIQLLHSSSFLVVCQYALKIFKALPAPLFILRLGQYFEGRLVEHLPNMLKNKLQEEVKPPGFTMDTLYHENVTNFAACNEKLHLPITTKVHVLIILSEFITKPRKPFGAFLWVGCGEVPPKIWCISVTRSRIVIIWIIWITFFCVI